MANRRAEPDLDTSANADTIRGARDATVRSCSRCFAGDAAAHAGDAEALAPFAPVIGLSTARIRGSW